MSDEPDNLVLVLLRRIDAKLDRMMSDVPYGGRQLSETRDAFGPLLHQLQAEMRSLRTEQRIFRQQLSDGITALLDRIGQSEALIATRFDRLMQRIV